MEIETPKPRTISVPVSDRIKASAEEKTLRALQRGREGKDSTSNMIRKGELDDNGNFVPEETKPAFAALDMGIDVDIAGELLGKYAHKATGTKFNTPKFSNTPQKALYTLGFDPIVELVKSYHEVSEELENMRGSSKYSVLVYTELVKVRNKIASDLVKYGYTPAVAEVDDADSVIPEIRIFLEGYPGESGEDPDIGSGCAESSVSSDPDAASFRANGDNFDRWEGLEDDE